MTPCYVFDLDGTLADCSHRLHHIMQKPKDWTAFHGSVSGDGLISHMATLFGSLVSAGEKIVYATGRTDDCRAATADWLERHGFSGPLYMRRASDHRNDDIVKLELLAQIRADGFEPIMWFEDRSRVVKALRAAGVAVMQCAAGDF